MAAAAGDVVIAVVVIVIQPGGGPRVDRGVRTYVMNRDSGFQYSVEIPGDQLRAGTLGYHITVTAGSAAETFPSLIAGHPTDWDFYGNPWTTRIVPRGAPILLFDAAADSRPGGRTRWRLSAFDGRRSR